MLTTAGSGGEPLRLGDLFVRGRNSFSVLRLVLATAVVASHSFYLAGYGVDPLESWTGVPLGAIAVDGFFALSGMLVTASLQRNPSIGEFVRHRLARLMPGFWVCLAFCAFVLAPIGVVADAGVGELFTTATLLSLVGYVVKNASTFIVEPALPHVLVGLQYRRINPCLWTLAPEAACYVLLAVAGALRLLSRYGRWILLAAFASTLVALSADIPSGAAVQRLLELGAHFLGGALSVLFLRDLRLSAATTLLFCAGYLVCLSVEPLQGLRAAAFAPALAALARTIPLHGRCDDVDVSYGIYLYGSAVQQFLAWNDLRAFGPWSFFVVSMAATLPLAWASWTFVERPALRRWAHRGARRRESAALPAS